MAQRITLRTLLGFRYSDDLKGKGISHIKEEHLIERALEDKDSLVNDLRATGFWNGTRSKEEMKFNAVVGNPPYQVVGGGGGSNDASIYQEFCDISFKVAPLYSSMIVPSRWYTGGRENLGSALPLLSCRAWKSLNGNQHTVKQRFLELLLESGFYIVD